MRRKLGLLASVLGLGIWGANAQAGLTGAFNGPLTNAIASVDINGGPITGTSSPTEGWNGSTATPTFGADTYGVTWSPWGGSTEGQGDGTAWPDSQTGQTVTASAVTPANPTTDPLTGSTLTANSNWFQKTFNGVTVTVSAPGTANQYASQMINSRDRGNYPGGYVYATGPMGNQSATTDGAMFQDLIFAGTNGNTQSTNYLQVQFSGLTPLASYQIALYSFDNSANNATNWTLTAPTLSASKWGWWAASPAGNNTFTAPADEQTISWNTTGGSYSGGETDPYLGSDTGLRAPALFTTAANLDGVITAWGFGGDGLADQNSFSTYLNGLQIAPAVVGNVPEPTTIGILGLASAGLLSRRRREA